MLKLKTGSTTGWSDTLTRDPTRPGRNRWPGDPWPGDPFLSLICGGSYRKRSWRSFLKKNSIYTVVELFLLLSFVYDPLRLYDHAFE